jgi:small subunit ribosomal protein S1
LLSKKKVDAARGIEFIEKAYENKTPVEAKVVEVIKGGIIAIANGVRILCRPHK